MGLFYKPKQNSNSEEFKPINFWFAIGLLIALFAAGWLIEDEKISQTLLNCFAIIFAGVIAFLGFEGGNTNKKS